MFVSSPLHIVETCIRPPWDRRQLVSLSYSLSAVCAEILGAFIDYDTVIDRLIDDHEQFRKLLKTYYFHVAFSELL